MRKPLALALSLSVALVVLTGRADAEEERGAQWSITPYIWAPITTVDVAFRNTDTGGGDVSFRDLLDILDAAFMIHVEGGKGNWSGFGDLTYLSTADTVERNVLSISTDSEQTFVDGALAYWPRGVGSPLSLFGGVRYTKFDDTYTFRRAANNAVLDVRRTTTDYLDALFGLRYQFDLSERWSLLTHGDLSFGHSEGTFLLRAQLAYTVGGRQRNRIFFGYQYKQAEFRDGDLSTDFTYHGPTLGFNFRF